MFFNVLHILYDDDDDDDDDDDNDSFVTLPVHYRCHLSMSQFCLNRNTKV